MTEIITIKNFYYKYPYSKDFILKNINLRIKKGEVILLSGASGSGKTTLARCIIGLIPQFYGGEYQGEVRVFNMDPSRTPIAKITEKVGYLFQNPDNQIFMSTVERDIAFSLEFRGYNYEEILNRVEWIINKLGIFNLRKKKIDELSGGEKQKVALASVLVLKPEVLILDEPCAYLSPSSLEHLINFLSNLNKEMNITIILIDHRLDLLLSIINRVIILKEGWIAFDGNIRNAVAIDLSKEYGVNSPIITRYIIQFKKRGLDLGSPITAKELANIIFRRVHG